MAWTAEIEATLNRLLEDYADEYLYQDQGVGAYDPDGRKRLAIEFTKNAAQGNPSIPSIRYEVLSEPNPLKGTRTNRDTLYSVVRIVGESTPEKIKRWDWFNDYYTCDMYKEEAYSLAAELTERFVQSPVRG